MPCDTILNTKKKMFWGKSINIQNTNDKKDLKQIKLYICLDFPYAIDTYQLLERILYYINNNILHSEHCISEIKEVIVDMPAHIIFDVLQEGMDIFTRMSTQIDLKDNTEESWFMYISTGCIKNITNGCTVILLNQDPRQFKCKYIINKKVIDLRKKMYYKGSDEDMYYYEQILDDSYFIIKESLNKLLDSSTILYENLYPIYRN